MRSSSSNNESNHIAAAVAAQLCMLLRLCLLLSFLLLSFCLLFHMTGKFVMLFMLLSSHAVDCQLFVAAAVAVVSVDFFLRASCLNFMNVVGNE